MDFELTKKKFNNIEYVLVDEYDDILEDEIIYHFKTLEDDIFCIIKNEKYIEINDEKIIELIKENKKLNLIDVLYLEVNPILYVYATKLKKIDNKDDAVNYIVEKVIKKFPEKNKDELENKLKKVEFFEGKMFFPGLAGIYHPISNSIVVDNKFVDAEKEKINRRTMLHEGLHAITGRNMLKYLLLYRGFFEGETENIVEQIYDEKQSSEEGDITFNLSKNCVYKKNVAIIRQMEKALGKDASNLVLQGDTKLLKEFSEKYGLDMLICVSHRLNLMSLNPTNTKYFLKTQNVLMKRIFDIDFKDVENLEDAKIYMSKLRDFELVRGRNSEDDFYRKYYEEKMAQINEKIKESTSKEDIEKFNKEFEYKQQEFYTEITEEEKKEQLSRKCIYEITRYVLKKQEKPFSDCEPEKVKIEDIESFNFFQNEDEHKECFLVEKDGKPYTLNMYDEEKNEGKYFDFTGGNEYKTEVEIDTDESGGRKIKIDGENIELKRLKIFETKEVMLDKVRENLEENKQYFLEMMNIAMNQSENSVQKVILKIKRELDKISSLVALKVTKKMIDKKSKEKDNGREDR